jgi:hypothetical protein
MFWVKAKTFQDVERTDFDSENLFDPSSFRTSKIKLPHELVCHCIAFLDVAALLVARRMCRHIEARTRRKVQDLLLQKFESPGTLCKIAPATFVLEWISLHPAWQGKPFFGQLGLNNRMDILGLVLDLDPKLRGAGERSQMLSGALGNAAAGWPQSTVG